MLVDMKNINMRKAMSPVEAVGMLAPELPPRLPLRLTAIYFS
jgi:hypothetical protein